MSGVKIVATIGPASSDTEKLDRLFSSGVDVFRLNFSHGSHEDHAKVYKAIRSIGKKYNSFPAILADLQGPKLRVGTFENDKIILEAGDIFRFDLDKTPGNTQRVNLPHPEILEALKVGTPLLLDDGKLRFEVLSCNPQYAEVKVLVGGPLSNRKGVNVPNVMLPISALTEKDRKDLDFALQLGVDWIALSFVQSVEDIERAKKIIKGRAGVVSKLEKPLAIEALEPIVRISDAIMIARGDLGVEMNPEDVPGIQRRIIDTCHRIGRPVIVATQMLESMITSPSPTRAEVSDVANAVYSGADATMLSAESASGQYPFEAVEIMSKVISKTESYQYCFQTEYDPRYSIKRLTESELYYIKRSDEQKDELPHFSSHEAIDAICLAARIAAEFSSADAIALFTNSFDTVAKCSRVRPRVPIILITNSNVVAGRAGLCNGVYAVLSEEKEPNLEKMCKITKTVALEREFVNPCARIVLLSDISGKSLNVIELSL